MTDYRDLPPVPVDERPEFPEFLSQTFLEKSSRCPRAGMLYLKRFAADRHELHRGTAFHVFAERVTRLCVEQGEPRIPADLAKQVLQEVMDDPAFVIPADQADDLRVMCWHFADALVVDPAEIVAIEQSFVLEVGGRKVRGRLDRADVIGGTAYLRDYKTSKAKSTLTELSGKRPDGSRVPKSFQLVMYALMFAFGRPVESVPCVGCEGAGERPVVVERDKDSGMVHAEYVDCEACDGAGEIVRELPGLGDGINEFDLAEVYPWFEGCPTVPGERDAPLVVSRAELVDWLDWLGGLVGKVEHSFESGLFPAVPGSQCGQCPASGLCPLPAVLRANPMVDDPNPSGELESLEDAARAAERWHFLSAGVRKLKADLRAFARETGLVIPIGSDLEFVFAESEREEWVNRADGAARLRDAVDRAVRYGEPFDYGEHRRVKTVSEFRPRKVAVEDEAPDEPVKASLDERFGADAPF